MVEETASFAQPTHVKSFSTDAADLFDDDVPLATRPHVLVLSANDESSLQDNFSRLRNHLLNPNVKVDLLDLCHTLSERRSRLYHRGYVLTSSTELDQEGFVRGKQNTNKPKIGFVFTGQGAQWSQMGKALVDTFSSAKATLSRLDKALQALPFPPAWKLIGTL